MVRKLALPYRNTTFGYHHVLSMVLLPLSKRCGTIREITNLLRRKSIMNSYPVKVCLILFGMITITLAAILICTTNRSSELQ